MKRNSVLIIPSLNPDEKLIDYVDALLSEGFERIILVDDGSREDLKPIFTTLERRGCDLLVHARNMGKGRALKDALNHYLNRYANECLGVITADSDGQHLVKDVIRLDDAMGEGGDALLLGVRDFDDPSVPFKSRNGNKITRAVMKLLIGGSISDTQTGLRGIPNRLCYEYLTLEGERFEYETTMLIETLKKEIPIREIVIDTVYINDNRETHFNPIRDSIAIYRLILSTFMKYAFSSIASFLVDYGLFCLLVALLAGVPQARRIWIGTVVARVLSSLFNYAVNRSVVFKSEGSVRRTMMRYYGLVVAQMCCSAALVLLATKALGWPETGVKPIVDVLLFLVSFQIQRRFVFK